MGAGIATALAATTLLAPAPAVERTCHARALAPGAPGAHVEKLVIPATGLLDARLDGSPHGPDWDLAVFDARSGRKLGASAAFGVNEVVRMPVTAGDAVTLQACHYAGDGPAPRLRAATVVVSGPVPRSERKSLVSIRFRSRADIERLQALGIDLNETGRNHRIDAVLHGAGDRRRLRRAGFKHTTHIRDLAAFDRAQLNARAVAGAQPLPSGRTSYRHLEDYEMDLKKLVDAHPGLVRPVILPRTSVEGRTIQGVEMAENVAATDDGRPTHVEMGLHHVREWSSGEVTIEFGLTLAQGYETDARITNLLRTTRTFLFPVINPDGLVASQLAGDWQPADDTPATIGLAAGGQGSYRRKNCASVPGDVPGAPCALQTGVDLNRNYGAFWGGPGSSDSSSSQIYRGPAPFSEPEAQAVHDWSSRHQVMVLNSNHNYAGDILYQPGFSREDEPGFPRGTKLPYEPQMIALANAMAEAAGYVAMYSYQLYDVTGATEDWNYFAQGAFGYTTEVGYDNFHPNYQDAVVDQYLGTVDGTLNSGAARKPSQGLREAFLRAGEAASDRANHAVIAGRAPAGRVLRIAKDFQTTTSNVITGTDGAPSTGPPILIPEHLESTLTVPSSGAYAWHVNPSTRPLTILAGGTEAWTLTCETPEGAVLETRDVVVAIGQTATVDLACGGPPPATAPSSSTLRLRVPSRRAGRRLVARVTLGGAGPVTKLTATLRDARGRTRARGRLARLTRSGRIVLSSRRALRPGRYRLTVSGRSPSASRLRATLTLRLR